MTTLDLAFQYLPPDSNNAVMSAPDKPATDPMLPKRGLAWPAAEPPRLALPAVPDRSELAADAVPAVAGQFGPGAMPRRRDQRVVYAVPCHADFRGAVLTLAKARGVAVAELVRMVLTLASSGLRAAVADPGEPGVDASDVAGRPGGGDRTRRPTLVPTLVLRLASGLDHATIRRSLALALALAGDDPGGYRLIRSEEHRRLAAGFEKLEHRNRALARAVERLAFRPRSGRLSPGDAASMLGFAGEHECDEQLVSKRFREIAPIFHPDTGVLPCRERMGQLIEARNVLIGHLRRPKP